MLGATNIITMAQTIAAQLAAQDPATQMLTIKRLRAQSPELADLVLQYLASNPNAAPQLQQQGGGQNMLGANGEAAAKVDTRPLPEKLPPRRAAGIV